MCLELCMNLTVGLLQIKKNTNAISGQNITKTHYSDGVCVFSPTVVGRVNRCYPRCVGRWHSLDQRSVLYLSHVYSFHFVTVSITFHCPTERRVEYLVNI